MSRLANLKLEARNILGNIKTGSHSKRVYREKVIFRSIYNLASTGNVPVTWHAFNGEHLRNLISHWRNSSISDESIRMYLAEIRFFLNSIGVDVIRDNKSVGLKRKPTKRKSAFTFEKLDSITDDLTLCIIKLQIYFGLTLSESFRFNPSIYYRGDYLLITREVTSNSRDRGIDIYNQEQKDTISAIESILPENNNIIEYYGYHSVRERYKILVTQSGLTSGVSYRDVFARNRYQHLIQNHSEDETKNILMDEMGISRITLWRYLSERG